MLGQGQIRIDMSLTDEKIFEVVSRLLADPEVLDISFARIAEEAGCHLNTARNAVARLENAGRLRADGGRGKPLSYTIEVVNE